MQLLVRIISPYTQTGEDGTHITVLGRGNRKVRDMVGVRRSERAQRMSWQTQLHLPLSLLHLPPSARKRAATSPSLAWQVSDLALFFLKMAIVLLTLRNRGEVITERADASERG